MTQFKSINPHAPKMSGAAFLGGAIILLSTFFLSFGLAKTSMGPSGDFLQDIVGAAPLFLGVVLMIKGTIIFIIGVQETWSNRFLKFQKGDYIIEKTFDNFKMESKTLEIMTVGKKAYGVLDTQGNVSSVAFTKQRKYREINKKELSAKTLDKLKNPRKVLGKKIEEVIK